MPSKDAETKIREEVSSLFGYRTASLPSNKSLTAKFLGLSDGDATHAYSFDLEKQSPNIVALLEQFPFGIFKILTSIMGHDYTLEKILIDKYRNYKDDLEYAQILVKKVLFLTEPDAFPLKNINTINYLKNLSTYIILLFCLPHLKNTNESKKYISSVPIPTEDNEFEKLLPENSENKFILFSSIMLLHMVFMKHVKASGKSEKYKKSLQRFQDIQICPNKVIGIDSDSLLYLDDYSIGLRTNDPEEDEFSTIIMSTIGGAFIEIHFHGITDIKSATNAILKKLIELEASIKKDTVGIINKWTFFTREPRRLTEGGITRLHKWWKRILTDSFLTTTLFSYHALASRLATMDYECQSSEIDEIAGDMREIWKGIKKKERAEIPVRLHNILVYALDDAQKLYDEGLLVEISEYYGDRRANDDEYSVQGRKRVSDHRAKPQ